MVSYTLDFPKCVENRPYSSSDTLKLNDGKKTKIKPLTNVTGEPIGSQVIISIISNLPINLHRCYASIFEIFRSFSDI